MREEQVDFLVAGSGAGGMVAAIRAHDLGLKTLVVEKAALYGGSSAYSGGVVWVPNNEWMQKSGMADSEEDALRYLEAITAGSSSTDRLRTYVQQAPRMLRYLQENSDIQYEMIPDYPDYFPELPGGKTGGRSCEPKIFPARLLGGEFARLRMFPRSLHVLGFLHTKASDGHPLMEGGLRGYALLLRRLAAYLFDIHARLRGGRDQSLTLGYALAASARYSLQKRKVPLWLESPIEELLVESGRVTGAIVQRQEDGKSERVRIVASKGVLLATGGFDHNAVLRNQHQPWANGGAWAAGAESNTGDAVTLVEKVRARLALMHEAWWCPVFRIPQESDFRRLVIFEKNLPGSILVNSRGERFMNEAAPYNDAGRQMFRCNREGAATLPAWLVVDSRFRHNYALGRYMPGYAVPDAVLPEVAWQFLHRDDTLAGLAAKIGVEAAGLARTVERFNQMAAEGKDGDFGRGDSAQDRYYTARTKGFRNPCLGPIAKPPFYAVPVWPGDLGTKGGMVTDSAGRVINEQGVVVAGLYATGNCSAAVMGDTYPGAGGTLGPSMTFGFLAAEDAAIRE